MPVRLPRLPSLRSISATRWRRIAVTGGIVVASGGRPGHLGRVAGAARLHHQRSDDHRHDRARTATSRSPWTPPSTSHARPARPTRCRRSCWRTGSAARSSRWPADAKDFANRGYAVLTWTAQGIGRSGGEIHLDSPDWEVRDAQRLIDWLAARPEIDKDGAERSAGGRGRRLVRRSARPDAGRAGHPGRRDRSDDHLERPGQRLPARVDRAGPGRGRVQEGLGRTLLRYAAAARAPSTRPGWRPALGLARQPVRRRGRPRRTRQCGRFAKDVCAAYQEVATTGQASPATIDAAAPVQPGPARWTGSRRRRC